MEWRRGLTALCACVGASCVEPAQAIETGEPGVAEIAAAAAARGEWRREDGIWVQYIDHRAPEGEPAPASGEDAIYFRAAALDGRCTLPGALGSTMDRSSLRTCCQAHDLCYAHNDCTKGSWLGTQGLACMGCNLKAVACVLAGGHIFGSQCDNWYGNCSQYTTYDECVAAVTAAHSGGSHTPEEYCEILGFHPTEDPQVSMWFPSGWQDGWWFSATDGWQYLGLQPDSYACTHQCSAPETDCGPQSESYIGSQCHNSIGDLWTRGAGRSAEGMYCSGWTAGSPYCIQAY